MLRLLASRIDSTIAHYSGQRDDVPERSCDEGLSPIVAATDPLSSMPSAYGDAEASQPHLRTVGGRGNLPGGRRPRHSSLWLGLVILGLLVVSLAPLDLLLPKVPVGGTVRDAITSEPI